MQSGAPSTAELNQHAHAHGEESKIERMDSELGREASEIGFYKDGASQAPTAVKAPSNKCLKYVGGLTLILVFLCLIIGAVTLEEVRDIDTKKTTNNNYYAADITPSNLPGFERTTWQGITDQAKTQTLNFYLWSPPGTSPRNWVDNNLSPALLSRFGITVNRMDAVYTGCDVAAMKLVCDVQNQINSNSDGQVDLVWINGANFKAMKDGDLLYGPFATGIPSSQNFDWSSQAIAFDKGVAIDGMEMPFNLAQFVFINNANNVPNPPQTIPALVQWIKSNPGKFTYSSPSTDFTGAAFLRILLIHYAGNRASSLYGEFDESLYNDIAPQVWQMLNDIESDLYQFSNGSPYAASHDDIRTLVGQQVLWMDMSFQHTEASTRILDPVNPWPSTMDAYVLSSPGTIADTNFLAIPKNAPNKAAALVAVNYIASASSMFVRSQPTVWGALQPFDPNAKSMQDWVPAFDYVDVHEKTPTVEELANNRLGDLNTDYVNRLNADWVAYVRDA